MDLTQARVNKLCNTVIEEAKASVKEDDRIHPLVGALLINDKGKILLKAHRGEKPGAHAEYLILLKAQEQGIDLSRCTLFVTLEPCIKRGSDKKPCAVRIVEAGIKTVYIGMHDPDPSITGRGVMYLQYADISVEFFPDRYSKLLREANQAFFDKFRAAHFWDAPKKANSLYGSGASTLGINTKPILSNTREGLLHQTLDLIIGSDGPVWIAVGDLSWFKELQVAFLAAALEKREIRLIFSKPKKVTNRADGNIKNIASKLSASVCEISNPHKYRFTLVGAKTKKSSAIFIENEHAELMRMPENAKIIKLLSEWFDRSWQSGKIIKGERLKIKKIDPSNIVKALKKGVKQYANSDIEFDKVEIESLCPSTDSLESFKLFRINQFFALRLKHNLHDYSIVEGTPWPLIFHPVIERLPDGKLVVIDGTHRIYASRARGDKSIDAIIVNNKNYDLPSQPSSGWNNVKIMQTKLSRGERYKLYKPKLFRPIREAFKLLSQ